MVEASVAKILLTAAREDARAMSPPPGRPKEGSLPLGGTARSAKGAPVSALCQAPEIGDATIGFHAQQAVEKAIKAVLSSQRIAFRQTHDLAELLDLLANEKITPPPHADCLDELNPYAVEARYGLVGPPTLDRKHGETIIGAVVA